MSRSEYDIDRIIEKWRAILQMDDWDIGWQWDDSLGVDAQVKVYYSERRMKMAFNHCILDYPEKEFEHTVAHEMVHGTTQPFDDFIRPWTDQFLPESIQVPFWRDYNDVADNVVVDDLVRILGKKNG